MLIFSKLIYVMQFQLDSQWGFFFELDNVIFKLHGRLSADKRQENMKKQ